VCLENTTNKGGGAVYSLAAMREISHLCREKGLRLHLDGARLFNAMVASRSHSQTSAAQPVNGSVNGQGHMTGTDGSSGQAATALATTPSSASSSPLQQQQEGGALQHQPQQLQQGAQVQGTAPSMGGVAHNGVDESDTGDEPYGPQEVGALFDSISICLSKGLGAPVGSLLIGGSVCKAVSGGSLSPQPGVNMHNAVVQGGSCTMLWCKVEAAQCCGVRWGYIMHNAVVQGGVTSCTMLWCKVSMHPWGYFMGGHSVPQGESHI
jgi:hypothetical protein